MTKVALESLGCKLNQAETESFVREFLDRGYRLTESIEQADIFILNTCTVTHVADRKTRHLLRWVRRNNPGALIAAVGCYSQRAPEELIRLGVVDLVLDNHDKGRLVDILEGTRNQGNREAGILPPDHGGRTRSLVKIQEGCNSYCSFCIVPYTRGEERCLSVEEVVRSIEERVAAGYQEIVLTGTNIGSYRFDGENYGGLARLVEHILERTEIKRLRLSSLQPRDLTPELLELWTDDRLCPHLHVPLQSGSQTVLQRMRRGYSPADYERAVALARGAIPGVGITTDVMVGFPGEEESEFEASCRFCKGMGFADIHVFPYSPRPGTAAAEMPGQVDERVKKDRSRQMLALARRSAQRFRERFLGQTTTVLWESKLDNRTWSGLTANYLRVFAESEQDLTNHLLETRLTGGHARGLLGQIANGG